MAASFLNPASPPSSASPFAWAPPPLSSHPSFERPASAQASAKGSYPPDPHHSYRSQPVPRGYPPYGFPPQPYQPELPPQLVSNPALHRSDHSHPTSHFADSLPTPITASTSSLQSNLYQPSPILDSLSSVRTSLPSVQRLVSSSLPESSSSSSLFFAQHSHSSRKPSAPTIVHAADTGASILRKITSPPPVSVSTSKPHKCDEVGCTMSFTRNHDLKRHARIHLDIKKPFECLACMKAFSRKDALRRHMLIKGCSEVQPISPLALIVDINPAPSKKRKKAAVASEEEETPKSPCPPAFDKHRGRTLKGPKVAIEERGRERDRKRERIESECAVVAERMDDDTERPDQPARGGRRDGKNSSPAAEGELDGELHEEGSDGEDEADGRRTPPPILQARGLPASANVHPHHHPSSHHPSGHHRAPIVPPHYAPDYTYPHPNRHPPYNPYPCIYPDLYYPPQYQGSIVDSRSSYAHQPRSYAHLSRYPQPDADPSSLLPQSPYAPSCSTRQLSSQSPSMGYLQQYQEAPQSHHSAQSSLPSSIGGHGQPNSATFCSGRPSVLAPGPSIPISTPSQLPSVLRPGPSPPKTAARRNVGVTSWGRPVKDAEEGTIHQPDDVGTLY